MMLMMIRGPAMPPSVGKLVHFFPRPLMQESLGGNSKTSLVVNCSPALLNRDETMSTLRFGVRAKKMVNTPRANKERSAAELKLALELKEQEVLRLKKRIAVLEGALGCVCGDQTVARAVTERGLRSKRWCRSSPV